MLIVFLYAIQFLFLLLALFLVAYMLYVISTMKNMVPYVPTSYWIIRKMIELAQLKGDEHIVDPGSGSGRIIFELARKHHGTITGIEYSPFLFHISRLRSHLRRKQCPVTILWADFRTIDFTKFNVVFCFLTSMAFKQLAGQFEAMKPGTKMISYMFEPIVSDAWEKKLIRVGRKEREKIFVCKKIR